MVLARPDGAGAGSRGLSLFALQLRHPDGSWNGLRVRRLKDKLGTRALPTAELDLDGTLAVPVGGLDRGVPKVATVLHTARVWAAQSGAGTTGQLLALARDYARLRRVSGGLLAAQPVHRHWMAEIAATYEAMLQLSLRSAQLLGEDDSIPGDGASALARIVVPLGKLACARQGVWASSQLLESFGGAGYLEDTGIPRLLRDVHVQCIWEGTTNVLALDVLRALRDTQVGPALLDDIEAQLHRYPRQEVAAGAEQAVRDTLPALRRMLDDPSTLPARDLAWALARTYQATLLIAQARWSAHTCGDLRTATAAAVFTQRPLVVPPTALGTDDLDQLAFAGYFPEEPAP